MEITVEKIRMLKGAPLSILMSMLLVRQPVTSEWLQAATGYTDKPVRIGLKTLAEFGYITRNGRYAWQITGEIKQLPLVAELPAAEEKEEDRVGIIPTPAEAAPQPETEIIDAEPVIVDNSVDKTSPIVDKSEPEQNESEFFRPGGGIIPTQNALASLESLTRLDSKKESSLVRGDEAEIIRLLDERGIGEPTRSEIVRMPDITLRLVAYHCKNAPNEKLAIYRIRNHWRVPKSWEHFPAPSVSTETVPEPEIPENDLESIDPEHEALFWIAAEELKNSGVLNYANYQTWVQPCVVAGSRASPDGPVMIVGVCNAFAADWLRERIRDQLEALVGMKIKFEVRS